MDDSPVGAPPPGPPTRDRTHSGVDERKAINRRRAGKTCHHCHARKIRCDVQQRGIPCSNCANQSISPCTVRRRKNARSSSDTNGTSIQSQLGAVHKQSQQTLVPSPAESREGLNAPFNIAQPPEIHYQAYPATENDGWQDPDVWGEHIIDNSPMDSSVNTTGTGIDFTYLSDLEDVFAYTDWTFFPPTQPLGTGLPSDPPSRTVQAPPGLSALLNEPSKPVLVDSDRVGLTRKHALAQVDYDFLQSQGCFSIPPIPILRQLMQYYFQYIHPNLPILNECKFAPLWTREDYRLDGVSLFVFRAMLFAATQFLDASALSMLGYSGQREARYACYRQAQLVFGFGLESEAFPSAQACLLLTYYGPNFNQLRANAGWLMHAARFARICRADTFQETQDPAQKSALKRLWWGVLFRDRILSLGLRWNLQVEIDPHHHDPQHFLNAEDFDQELGNSHVHDHATQLRLIEIANAKCNLMCALTPALQILYREERIPERIASVRSSGRDIPAEIQQSLDGLRRWYDQAIRTFPEPIGLDDTHESICIYANLMFCYYATTVFALNFYRILIYETIPSFRDRIQLETCHEASIAAVNDLGKRIQEVVQMRLTRFLPISMSAYIALPLLLQAINMAAVRGSALEAVEGRRLDIYTKVLKSQQQMFDGADFCTETLSNIVAFVQQDEKFVDWMAAWRDERESNGHSSASSSVNKHQSRVKLGWASLMRKRPKLWARLLSYLDSALCKGTAPKDEDLLPELLRASPKP